VWEPKPGGPSEKKSFPLDPIKKKSVYVYL
jgi:hypothetical protein